MAAIALSFPQHLTATRPSLDPYGHLLRMLMPRAVGIGFYDADGKPMWVADGYEGPDPLPLVRAALSDVPPATTARIRWGSSAARNSGRLGVWLNAKSVARWAPAE